MPTRQPEQQQQQLSSSHSRDSQLDLWRNRLVALPPTPRSVALAQLLRVEAEGAFVNRLAVAGGDSSSSSSAPTEQQLRQRARQVAESDGDSDVEAWWSGGEEGEEPIAAAAGRGSSSGKGARPDLRGAVVGTLDARGRRQVTELVSGVTRWRRRLDFLLQHLAGGRDPGTVDAPVRQLLRMGLYELLELGMPP